MHAKIDFKRKAWQVAQQRAIHGALDNASTIPTVIKDIITDYAIEGERAASENNPEFEALVQKFMSAHKNEAREKGFFSFIKFYLDKIRDGIVKVWHKIVNAIRGKQLKVSNITENTAQTKQPLAIVSDARILPLEASAASKPSDPSNLDSSSEDRPPKNSNKI